jgi:hypothetical protein
VPYSFRMRRFVLVLALSVSGCRGAESPPPFGGEGQTCKRGERVVRECASLRSADVLRLASPLGRAWPGRCQRHRGSVRRRRWFSLRRGS